MLSSSTVKAIQNALSTAESVLVITHVSPDGDAISSLVAMGLILQQLGKHYTLVCDDKLPERYFFLPISNQIKTVPEAQIEYQLIIALDAGDKERLGQAYANLTRPLPPVINIDHHITNTLFGAINVVNSDATATVEILYHLCLALELRLTSDLATNLLTGLVTDTLSFRTAGVTASTLYTAAALVDAGADLYTVTSKALDIKPLSTVLVWQKGLNNMRMEDGIAWTVISNQEREEAGHTGSSSFGLGNMLAEINEAAMSAVLLETANGQVSVGFRSRPPYNVSEIARSLGGGGHDLAAGCTVDGPLEQAEELVITRSKELILKQRLGFSKH